MAIRNLLQFSLHASRLALRFLRTGRYVLGLLVWSKIIVARRTSANIEINPRELKTKSIDIPQPHLTISGRAGAEHIAHGFSVIYDVLFANLRKAGHGAPVRSALPGPSFFGVYLWDSAFTSLIWQYWDRRVAQDVLFAVIALRDGNKLQHVVADLAYSPYTQPPLVAWAAIRLFRSDRFDKDEIASFFGPLQAYHDWLNDNRRLPNGLYYWAHPYESGVENSPRFSSRDEHRLSDTTRLAAPDLCSYMVLHCEALSEIAGLLDRDDDANRYAREAAHLRELINVELWHEADAMYYDLHVEDDVHVRSRTIASLVPLAAGVPDSRQAQRMLAHIVDGASFGSPLPFPSVALNDPAFAKDMWRGPVWINMAYLVLDGLRRYRELEIYATLAWRLCDGVFRVLQNEQQVYEFYDPEYHHTRELTRKKGNWWKALTLGSAPQKDFVGWTGLVNTLIIEGLFGYCVSDRGIEISPNFPGDAIGLTFRLELPQDRCRIRLTVDTAHDYTATIDFAGETDTARLRRGDRWLRKVPSAAEDV